jgi:hypothetical protein
MTVAEEELQLRVKLEGIMRERFLALKQRLGFESNTDLVRLLITRAYEQEIGKPGAT